MGQLTQTLFSVLLFFCCFLLLHHHSHGLQWHRYPSPWTWECQNQTCVKMERGESLEYTSISTCKMTCGEYGALWPYPSGRVSIGNTVRVFKPENLDFTLAGPTEKVREMLQDATKLFQTELQKMHPDYANSKTGPFNRKRYDREVENTSVVVAISVAWKDENLTLTTEESYTLAIKESGNEVAVVILANTFFGARHGLETLSQLIDYDEQHDSLQIVNLVTLTDRPAFPYRAITLDTGRNYISLDAIFRTLDAMSYNKLNTLHWHITDTHSFPLYSIRQPQLTLYGAYSPSKVYLPEKIKELVEYARVRGIRIVPEFDAPAHVGNGWQWGPKDGKGNMVVCLNQEPWAKYCVEPPCGQLNPINDNIYPVLGDIYKDLFDVFQSDVFHMGGDEVDFVCWNTTQEITDYMDQNKIARDEAGFLVLWNDFQTRAYEKVKEANNGEDIPVLLWTSHLTNSKYSVKYLDPTRHIVQIWTLGTDQMIADLVENNFRVIFSNYDAWYLDCGFGAWVGEGNNWCSPYKGWQLGYDNSPLGLLAGFKKAGLVQKAIEEGLVLGGSAAMWTEQVDESALDAKLWPRAAALAERLWSNPSTTWREAEFRMVHHRERLKERGIFADALQPEWCHQNEGHCYANN